jgi:hypothetical protein
VSDNHYLIASANISTFFDYQKQFEEKFQLFFKLFFNRFISFILALKYFLEIKEKCLVVDVFCDFKTITNHPNAFSLLGIRY